MLLVIPKTVIGIIAGILTSASLLPQLFKMIKEKQATNASAGMFIVLMSGVSLWIWYGIMKNDWPIIITNAFSFLINIAILILRNKYKKIVSDVTTE